MKQLFYIFVAATCAAACGNSKADKPQGSTEKPKGSPDWGDDPRPLGACIATVAAGVKPPPGPGSYCLEKQTKSECTAPSQTMDYVYAEHETCASRGYAKQCEGTDFPSSTRFKECPTAQPAAAPAAASPAVQAGTQAVALMQQAVKAANEGGDCAALGKRLAPMRDQLWDIGKANPSLFRNRTDGELTQLRAADAMEALANSLPRCKDNVNAKEFMFAVTKLM